MAALIGSLITYGIGYITGASIPEWELMFLILGAVTAGFGLLLIPILPDSPARAIFLNKQERAIAVQRTLRNKTGVLDNGTFNWKQAVEALKDPQAWLLALYTFSVNLWNGGLTTVSLPYVTCVMNSTVDADVYSSSRSSLRGSALAHSKVLSIKCHSARRRYSTSFLRCYSLPAFAHGVSLRARRVSL